MLGPKEYIALHEKLGPRWIQYFGKKLRFCSRDKWGKNRLNHEMELMIEDERAEHLGCICGLLTSGKVSGNNLENAEETHFVINIDNRRTVDTCRSGDV